MAASHRARANRHAWSHDCPCKRASSFFQCPIPNSGPARYSIRLLERQSNGNQLSGILDPFSLVRQIAPACQGEYCTLPSGQARRLELLRARFQVHAALLAPIAETEAMPCGGSDPIAMQHAERDDRNPCVAEPFVGGLEHRLH